MAKKYQSQSGFVTVSVRRGFEEIKNLFKIIEVIKDETPYDIFILGGYVRWMCSPKENPTKAGDIDVYSESQQAFDELKSRLMCEGLEVRAENPMALTFKVNEQFPQTVQLIKPIREGAIVANGTKEEILSHFDFTVIRIGLVSETNALADADYLHDEQAGILRLKNIHCPISSTLRCMKYARKGYFLRPVESLKLFADWDNRTDEYKFQIINGLRKIESEEQLSQEDIEQLERLMRID